MTDAPSAIAGQFVKLDAIATRKVVRLSIEIPIEHADRAISALGGYPDPANAKWVGIAPMDVPVENTMKGGALAQAAGIICNEGAFKQYAKENGYDSPEEYMYAICGVESRAHLDHNKHAAACFRALRTSYDNWLKDVA